MRYLQLMWAYAPAWGFGGPVRLMYDYARWFARHGHDVHVIAGDVNHDYGAIPVREEVMEGVRIRRVRTFLRSLVARSLNFVSPSMFFRSVILVWGNPGVTVIHVGELRSPVFLYAALVRRLCGRRAVLVHTASGMLHDKPSRLRRGFDTLFMGFLIRSVDLGLAQNDHEAAVYRAFCTRYRADAGKVAMLPLHTEGAVLSADLVAMDQASRRALLRDRYAVSRSAFVCIFLGRLHPEKGILRAMDAVLAFARRSGRECLLLIVGRDEGFQGAIVRRIAELEAHDQVRVVNNVYRERFEYYGLADAYVGFPTIFEETMLASVEALSCGTPVLVSREADLPFVESCGAGFVIDFTIDGAALRLEQIAADPAGYRARAAGVAAAYFSAAAACTKLNELLEGMTCRSPG